MVLYYNWLVKKRGRSTAQSSSFDGEGSVLHHSIILS